MLSHVFRTRPGDGNESGCSYTELMMLCGKAPEDPIHGRKIEVLGERVRPSEGGEEPVVIYHSQTPALVAWDSFSAEVRALIAKKSEGYGNAWQEQGYMGNLARILSKTARLRNMLWRENPWLGTGGDEASEEQESALDTLHDMAALCAFFVANLRMGQRWGRRGNDS